MPETIDDCVLIRRSRFTSITVEDGSYLDLEKFLGGTWHVDRFPVIQAFSALSQRSVTLERCEFDLFARVPASSSLPAETLAMPGSDDMAGIDRLIEAGLLLTDRNTPRDRHFRRLEAKLIGLGWNPQSAAYHFYSRWSETEPDFEIAAASREEEAPGNEFDVIADRYGSPPSQFFSSGGDVTIDLPLVRRDDGLFGDLLKRETVRKFDRSRAVPRVTLAELLYYVYGAQGYGKLSKSLVVLKKTSPSGGALHETEAYLLLARTEGVDPGIYHYNVALHALERIEAMSAADVGSLIAKMTAGQHYLSDAPVMVVMVSRFDRLFWKYRNHKKAYKVALMNAAHLSQTFYLVSQALGLGACFTAAVRDTLVEARLRLDPSTQGVAGVSLCGWPSIERDPQRFDASPFVPRVTRT